MKLLNEAYRASDPRHRLGDQPLAPFRPGWLEFASTASIWLPQALVLRMSIDLGSILARLDPPDGGFSSHQGLPRRMFFEGFTVCHGDVDRKRQCLKTSKKPRKTQVFAMF